MGKDQPTYYIYACDTYMLYVYSICNSCLCSPNGDKGSIPLVFEDLKRGILKKGSFGQMSIAKSFVMIFSVLNTKSKAIFLIKNSVEAGSKCMKLVSCTVAEKQDMF